MRKTMCTHCGVCFYTHQPGKTLCGLCRKSYDKWKKRNRSEKPKAPEVKYTYRETQSILMAKSLDAPSRDECLVKTMDYLMKGGKITQLEEGQADGQIHWYLHPPLYEEIGEII